MLDKSLFKARHPHTAQTVTVQLNGRPLQVLKGCSVAAAMLASGIADFRGTPVSGARRAPYCMMGACFDCLIEIDGRANRQACLVEVRQGMLLRTHEGARELPGAEQGNSHVG